MSRLKIYITGMFMLFLSGCSLFNPYIDRRRNPGVSDVSLLYSGPSRPNQPVICYNPLLTNDDELQKIADEECVKNETGIRDGKLLLPNHAHYICTNEATNDEADILKQYTDYVEKDAYENEEDTEYDEFTFGE